MSDGKLVARRADMDIRLRDARGDTYANPVARCRYGLVVGFGRFYTAFDAAK